MICMHLKPRSMKTHFCYFAFLNVKDMLILSKRYFLSDHSMSEGGRGLSQSLFSNLNACYKYTCICRCLLILMYLIDFNITHFIHVWGFLRSYVSIKIYRFFYLSTKIWLFDLNIYSGRLF